MNLMRGTSPDLKSGNSRGDTKFAQRKNQIEYK